MFHILRYRLFRGVAKLFTAIFFPGLNGHRVDAGTEKTRENGGCYNLCVEMYRLMHRSKHSTAGSRRPAENTSKLSCPRVTELAEEALFCDLYRSRDENCDMSGSEIFVVSHSPNLIGT